MSSDPFQDSGARLSPRALIERLREVLAGPVVSRSVVLVVALNRSDRLQALAQNPDSLAVTIEVVRRIRTILRSSDHYAMASQDEFWVLLVDLPNVSLAELAARTLHESLARPIHLDREGRTASIVQLEPNIGVSWSPRKGCLDPMILLGKASDACAQANQKDDHVALLGIESDEELVNRNDMERSLRQALQGNALEVYFQPQIDYALDRCVSVEALIRWNNKDNQVVSPTLIASLCEERGMMGQLTQFVLNTALRHVMAWKSQGIDVGVAINISALSLADSTFPALVGQALATWGVQPERLTLELTESSIVRNERQAMEFMGQLRLQGCRLAIDDFGTGYSSFAYLRQFPLNELKIDQSFVRNLGTDRGDQRIVHALIDLAHTFDLRSLAEGVETAEVAALLRKSGCDLGQGYLYSQALPAARFVSWYRSHVASVTSPVVAAVPG